MSFAPASLDREINNEFTTLKLNGGRNVDATSKTRLHVDLYVKGGALIKKDICVLGNIASGNISTSTLTAGMIVTDELSSSTGTITVSSNVVLSGPTELTSNTINVNDLHPVSGGTVTVNGNLNVTDTLNVGSFSVTELEVANIIGLQNTWRKDKSGRWCCQCS